MCMKNAWHNFSPKIFWTVFLFNWDGENISEHTVFEKLFANTYAEWQNNAKFKKVPPKYSPAFVENVGKIISTWNFGYCIGNPNRDEI